MMRQLPWAPEAEHELVACPLIDARVFDQVREVVSATDFYQAASQTLWQTMLSLYDEHGALDYPLVREALRLCGKAAPGDSWDLVLGKLLDRAGTTSNAMLYAERVRETARLRAVIQAAEDIAHEGCERPDDVEAFACRSQEAIRSAAEQGSVDTYRPARTVIDVFERLCEAKKDGPRAKTRGKLTGFDRFDRLTDGLRKLTISMGRPGMGKTTLAFSWAWNVAKAGGRVFVWEGELDDDETFGRFISLASLVPYGALENRYQLGDDFARRASDAVYTIADLKLGIDCKTALTADQIVVRANRAARELGGLDLIIVDHFHLMSHPRAHRSERTDEAMARSSGVLRDLAKNLAPVVVCAQLSRHVEQRSDRRPMLSDMRECGALEQDAHLVVSPYRPYVYDNAQDKGNAELLVRKNRSGPLDDVPLLFHPTTIRFSEP